MVDSPTRRILHRRARARKSSSTPVPTVGPGGGTVGRPVDARRESIATKPQTRFRPRRVIRASRSGPIEVQPSSRTLSAREFEDEIIVGADLPREAKPKQPAQLIERSKSQRGVSEGQARYFCSGCMKSFVADDAGEGKLPEQCPEGHAAA